MPQNLDVALKVPIQYRDSDKAELMFHKKILRLGYNPDEVRIVKFLECVWLGDHPCPVMECLGENLHQLFADACLEVSHVRSIGHQLLKAISCLKTIGIVHGDIKPGNILFSGMNGQAIGIKLADLGGFEVNQQNPPRVHHRKLTTLHYRSPEMLVGLKASFPIDMWSVALVLVELLTGRCLFPARSEMDLIHFIARFLGVHGCFLEGEFCHQFFVEGELTLKEHPKPEKDTVFGLEQLFEEVKDCSPAEQYDTYVFLCFVKKALHLNPSNRISCEEAFSHDFFTLRHLNHGKYHEDAVKKDFML